ncbi:hypothetical protein FRC06_007693 [Ceratobasidium sp. 370]|nr:hypothetical protein FRC06_007693 [Ceratobasidium sp. 370]
MADTSSTPSSVHRIPPLRRSENYTTWRIQMEDILTDMDMYGHVSSSKPMPPLTETEVTITPPADAKGVQPPDTISILTNSSAQDAWLKVDRKALSHIRLRVDAHSLTHIQNCTLSAQAWNLLSATFQVQGTVGLIDL